MAIFGPKQRSVDQTWWINIFWRNYLIWDPCLYLWWAPGGAVCGGPCVSQNQTCLRGSLCGLTSSLLSKPSVLQLIVSAVRLWNTKDSFVTWWPADLLYRLLQRTYWLFASLDWLAGWLPLGLPLESIHPCVCCWCFFGNTECLGAGGGSPSFCPVKWDIVLLMLSRTATLSCDSNSKHEAETDGRRTVWSTAECGLSSGSRLHHVTGRV